MGRTGPRRPAALALVGPVLATIAIMMFSPGIAGAITVTTPDAGRGPHATYNQPTALCARCHQVHSGVSRRFTRGYWNGGASMAATEEGTCYTCHDGTGSGTNMVSVFNVRAQFQKTFSMPIESSAMAGIHIGREPTAAAFTGTTRDPVGNTQRHVECIDCHNPHVDRGPNHMASAPTNAASRKLAGVWGVTIDYKGKTWSNFTATGVSYDVVTPDIQYEWQLCFKCHSGYAYGSSPPVSPSFSAGYNVTSGYSKAETDQSKEFNPANLSYHPVMAVGKNDFSGISGNLRDMVTLDAGLGQLTATSLISCSDCHRRNATESLSVDLTGPHGSTNPFILMGKWDFSIGGDTGNTNAYPTNEILCFNCHDRGNYFANGSNTGFYSTQDGANGSLHYHHLVAKNGSSGDKGPGGGYITCMNCHSAIPHGSPRQRLLIAKQDPPPYRTSKSRLEAADNVMDGSVPTGNYGCRDCQCDIAMNTGDTKCR